MMAYFNLLFQQLQGQAEETSVTTADLWHSNAGTWQPGGRRLAPQRGCGLDHVATTPYEGSQELEQKHMLCPQSPASASGFRAHHSSELAALASQPPPPAHPRPMTLNMDTWWSFEMNILGRHWQD
jgi:hypothetical protein